jgi:hypothetical protein
MFIANIVAFTILVIPDIIAISDISTTQTAPERKNEKNVHKKFKKCTQHLPKMHRQNLHYETHLKCKKMHTQDTKNGQKNLKYTHKIPKMIYRFHTDILPGH